MVEFEETVNTPETPEEEQGFTIDDVILGTSDDAEKMIVQQTEKEPEESQKPDNDETRYAYWQSQADLQKNENEQLKKQISKLQEDYSQTLQRLSKPQETPETSPADEGFPDPPKEPTMPVGYNEEDATTNPGSPSAQYVASVQKYYNDMLQYTNLKSEYANRRLDELRNEIRQRDTERAQAEKARQENIKRLAGITESVMTKYGCTKEQAVNFVRTMSSPDSLSLDNLWKLYTLQTGIDASGAQRPSNDFVQQKRAQSIPSPLGLQPGQGTSQRNVADIIMDDLVKDHMKRDPFGYMEKTK